MDIVMGTPAGTCSTIPDHTEKGASSDVARMLNQIAEEYEIALEAYGSEEELADGPDPSRHPALERNERHSRPENSGCIITQRGQQQKRPQGGTDEGVV